MKILVGNNALGMPGGSETFTFTLITKLLQLGHEVECVTKRKGIVSKNLIDLGITIHSNFIYGSFDTALLSHYTSISLASNVNAFKVQTCHGIYPLLEQPVYGMNKYVSISEEVQDHLLEKGFPSTVIYNGVDCERFKPVRKLNNKAKVVLSLAHSESANVVIRKACIRSGLKLIEQNKFGGQSRWDMENLINEADIVIGLGRSAYEACACGRNVIIADARSYMTNFMVGDGFLTKTNIVEYLKSNCSGRFTQKAFGEIELCEEFKKYNPLVGEELREFALENLNMEKQVTKYLSLGE